MSPVGPVSSSPLGVSGNFLVVVEQVKPVVQVVESYRDWVPALDIAGVVERMVAAVPERYLAGLGRVVLTCAGELPRRRRGKIWSKKKKVPIERCRGLYHHKHREEQAWIELFVDNILEPKPPRFFRSLLVESAVGEVLYHELGHHIHSTQARQHRDREAVADEWAEELLRDYFRQKYQVLRLVLRLPLRFVLLFPGARRWFLLNRSRRDA